MVVAGRDDQQPVDAPLAEELHELALASGSSSELAAIDEHAARARDLLDAARDRRVERVRDVLDHEAEHARTLPAAKRPRDVVAAKAERSIASLDERRRLWVGRPARR